MLAQERKWRSKTNEELKTFEKLEENCKKLKAEETALEVKCVVFPCYLNITSRSHTHTHMVCLSVL
jgi:hypothetical protein